MLTFTAGLIGCLIGYFFGWVNAHLTVADECNKLGAFYVNKTVYHCVKKEDLK